MQIFAPTQAPDRPPKKQNLAAEKTATRSRSGEEEKELQEENEQQEENERPSVEQDFLQICAPKRCRGLPPMNRMLDENECRIKAKESEELCSELTKQLEEFR